MEIYVDWTMIGSLDEGLDIGVLDPGEETGSDEDVVDSRAENLKLCQKEWLVAISGVCRVAYLALIFVSQPVIAESAKGWKGAEKDEQVFISNLVG